VAAAKKELVGVDVFVQSRKKPPEIVEAMKGLAGAGLQVMMLTNRGVKLWPPGSPDAFCTDHFRVRFKNAKAMDPISHQQIADLLGRIGAAGWDFIKIENLYTFNGELGFTKSSSE